MYNKGFQQPTTQPAPKKRDRFYRNLDGDLFKTVIVGFHIETGEQLAVLRRIEDGTVWVIPATDLKKRVLVNGTPTYVYAEDFTYQEEVTEPPAPFNPPAVRQSSNPYPGYIDDPRSMRPNPVTDNRPPQQRSWYSSHTRYQNQDDTL